MSSANQYPIDTSYPYRLIGSYASPSRARRINARLAEMEDITPDDFRKLKLDTRNLRAESVLSVLLKFIARQALSPNETAVFQELLAWNFFAHAEKSPLQLLTCGGGASMGRSGTMSLAVGNPTYGSLLEIER